MIDIDTFGTVLYVLTDDFCKANLSPDIRQGPNASLSRSEVINLAVFGQWTRADDPDWLLLIWLTGKTGYLTPSV